MSAGPWVVEHDGEEAVSVVNTETGVELLVFGNMAWTFKEELAEAHRIAERLNKTEGDER